MPIVSGGDLALQRGQAHKSDVYVSFLIPPILWKARIDDGSIVKGQTSFTYDGGTGSDYGLIGALQEIWVGTTDGDYDVGKLRVRSISTGDGGVTGGVTVAGHSLPLGDDQYLTFLHHYPLRPRYSYLDPSTKVWYMDTILAYTDEHEEPPPVVVAGPHRAGFLDSTPEFTINVDASDSYVIAAGASITSYALSVASTSGTPTVTFSAVTGLGDIKFTLPGYYWAKYTVTDSNGKSQDSYRCYFVHEDNRASSWYPFVDLETLEIGGDWDSGGWAATMDASDNYSFDDIPEHTLTVIWRRSWFGDTEKNITFLPDECSTIFAGYVRDEAEEQDFATGVGLLDLSMGTVEGKLRQLYSFSASIVAQKTSVDDWFEGPTTMTVGTIAHHILRWRSTLFEVADVIGLMDNTLLRFAFEPDDANLYDMVNSFTYESSIRAKLVCDQGGRMHLAYDIQLLTNSERAALSTVFDIKKDAGAADYGGRLSIPRKPENEVPFITSDGVYWDGTTWDPDDPDLPYATGDWCVIAPGGIGLEEGPAPKDFPLQTVSSLDHLRQIAGRYLAKTNNPIEELRVEFSGDYLGVLDVAYDDSVWTISLLSGDTPRGRAWTDKPLFCRNIVARFRGDEGVFNVNASFEVEAAGIDGVETSCPGFPLLGGTIPVIPLPTEVPGALMTGSSVHFKSASGNSWDKRVSQDVLDLIEDPYWRIKQASTSPSDAIAFRCGVGYIKRTTDAFVSVDVDVTPSNAPPNDGGDSPAPTATGVTYIMMEGSYPDQDEFSVLARWQNGSNEWRSWIAYTDDNGTTWSWKFLGAPPAGCLSPGTNYAFDTAGAVQYGIDGPGYDQLATVIIEISSGKFVVCYKSADASMYVCAFTFSGDVPTYGTPVAISNAVWSYGITMFEIDPITFGICYWEPNGPVSGSGNSPVIAICTVGGTIITPGSANHILTQDEYNLWFVSQNQRCLNFQAVSVGSSIVVLRFGNKTLSNGSCTAGSPGWYLLWGTRTGSSITFGTQICGTSDLKTVGLWRTVDTNRFVISMDCEGITMSSSYGLFVYHHSDDNELVALGVGSAENNFATDVITDSGWYPSSEFNLRKLTATKAILVHTSTLTDPFDEELYARMINLVTVTPSVASKYHITAPTAVDNYTDIAVGRLSDTDAIVYFIEWWVEDIFCTQAQALTSVGNTIVVSDWCKSFLPRYNYKAPIGRTATTFISAETVSGTNGNIRTGLSVTDVEDCLPYDESYSLGISLAKDTGGVAWVTAGNGTILELLEITLSTMAIANRFSLGNATIIQIQTETYVAYPFVPFGYDDAVYIYGRMNDPQSLGAPAHVIRTVDGGSSFGLIEDGWGVDHCGALIVLSSNYMFAIRNRGSQAKLYKDNADNNLVVKATLPFNAEVAPHGLMIDKTIVYACSWAADPVMVVKILSPYSVATDITFDHEAIEGVWSIIDL